MPINLELLKAAGYSQEKLKERFDKPYEEMSDADKRIINRHADRIQRGVTRSLEDAQYYRALDDAFDIGQRQVSITMMRRLIDVSKASEPEVMKAATEWGLSDMLVDLLDAKGRPIIDTSDPTKTRTQKRLDLPVFFNVFIPLVMAYTKIRAAFLFNERDIWPPYKYEPQHLSLQNKVAAELVTQRVTRMYQEMGYRSVDRQSILAMLQYGWCANFPQEPFYQETQPYKDKDGKSNTKVIREGVRFDIPHPTKVFWDEAWPLHTLNSDVGCSYVGYWKIQRYGDLDGLDIWNKDRIEMGANSWQESTSLKTYLSQLYPCAVKMPVRSNSEANVAGREDKAFTYTADAKDDGVGTVVIFEKINPKKECLYDYDHWVWHRFVYAGDKTIISLEPFAYAPGPFYLYDYDANRWRNSSLVGELLPFQDHVSNLFSQYLIQVKNNLDNVTFWNRSVLSDDEVKLINNLGQKRFTGRTFIPFEPRETMAAGTTIQQAFHSPSLPNTDVNTTLNAITAGISLMERTLGFSSQEVGASSEYKPSATEVNVRVGAASTRINYTGSFIDDATHAKKQRLYDAIVAYSSDDIFAMVADLSDTDVQQLKEIGFEIERGPGARAGVRIKPHLLSLDNFVAQREGRTRSTDASVAAAMINIFQMVFSNQAIVEQVGVKNLMKRFNEILHWAGVPGDWRFDDSNLTGEPKQDAEQATQQAGSIEQILQQAVPQIMTPVVEGIVQRMNESEQATVQGLQQVAEGAAQGIQASQANVAQLLDQKLGELAAVLQQQQAELAGEVAAIKAVQVPPPVQIPIQ